MSESADPGIHCQLGLGLDIQHPPGPRIVRCLSLWQPWASLVAIGAKFIETRSWYTHVRGELFIHAAASSIGIQQLRDADLEIIQAMEKALGIHYAEWQRVLPFGKILGSTNVVGCMPTQVALRLHPDQKPFGNFGESRWAHFYEGFTPIEPVEVKAGQLFFFAEIEPTGIRPRNPADDRLVK